MSDPETIAPPALVLDNKNLLRWQTKLLPFMMVSLVVLATVFFVITLVLFSGFRSAAHQAPLDIVATLDKLQASKTALDERDWHVRALLEVESIKTRHAQSAAVVDASVWTRFMGFMTGMVLVIAGCVFILGKLEVSFDGGAKAAGGEGVIRTNSPGLVLAALGSVLIAVAMLTKVTLSGTEAPVYLAGYWVADSDPAPVKQPPPRPYVAASEPKSAASRPADGSLVREQLCRSAPNAAGCKK